MLEAIPIVESGFWAEFEAGGQHLRLFAVETMLGLPFVRIFPNQTCTGGRIF